MVLGASAREENFVGEIVVNKERERRERKERGFLSKDSTDPFHTLPFTYNCLSPLSCSKRFSLL
jgi:hypothetical protein